MDLWEFGKRRANPLAITDNSLRLPYCDPDAAACEDLLDAETITNTEVLISINLGGVDIDIPVALQTAVDDDAAMKAALEYAIGLYEFDVYVTSAYAGGNLTVTHIGQLELASITTDGGTYALTRTCESGWYCTYAGTTGNAETTTTLNGVSGALAAYANAGELKTHIETRLTAGSIDYKSVAVVNGSVANTYDVTIVALSPLSFLIGADPIIQGQCTFEYIHA